MTNILENRNVRRLFYMKMNGRRIQDSWGISTCLKTLEWRFSTEEAEAVSPESEGFSCSGATQHSLDYSSFQILLLVMSQPLPHHKQFLLEAVYLIRMLVRRYSHFRPYEFLISPSRLQLLLLFVSKL